ncbi:hypothetical protein B0H14DRAFT_2406612, partial [Mycena olivaceomarginata]
RHAVKQECGKIPTDEEIWKSIRDKDITRTIRDFFWRVLHKSYKCGSYWRNIPTYEQWATCNTCNVDETMEHILVECCAPGKNKIWQSCRNLWEKTLPDITISLLLGYNLVEFKNAKRKKMHEAGRLFKILVSESAHMDY